MNRAMVFDAIADERRLLADVLDTLDEQAWSTQSLCSEWTVRDVAAHLVMPLITPIPAVVRAVVRARGNVARANTAVTADVASRHGHDLGNLLRRNAENRFTPPVGGPQVPLTDLLIHGQDIRRPLGLTRDIDPTRARAALEFLSVAKSRFFSPSRVDVRWVATDVGWTGGRPDAPVVEGPAEAILLVRTGRSIVLGELAGPGVDLLASGS